MRRDLTPADDEFHPPRAGVDDWAETAWFSAAIPERGLGIWTYPLFRPTLGVASMAVYVWGPGATELWQLPYYRLFWHMPIPEGLRLTEMSLPSGLRYRALEPLTRYSVDYADGDEFRLHLEYTGLHEPRPVGVTDEVGHLDQFCRVQGELVLLGERMTVDCVSVRDRTWSPRRESRKQTRVGYAFGSTLDGQGFLLQDRRFPDGSTTLLNGFLLQDGRTVDVVEGRREVERDTDGRPTRVTVTGRSSNGADLSAVGEVASQFAMHTTPYFVWVSQIRWTCSDGTTMHGEDQDTWSPAVWRQAARSGW